MVMVHLCIYLILKGQALEVVGSGVHQNWMSFEPDINQTSTSSYTALNVDVTETATGLSRHDKLTKDVIVSLWL